MPYYYISFASANEFLGGVVVRAEDEGSAVLHDYMLGINPGGQALVLLIPAEQAPPAEAFNRLLSRADVERYMGNGKSLRQLIEEGADVSAGLEACHVVTVCEDCNGTIHETPKESIGEAMNRLLDGAEL